MNRRYVGRLQMTQTKQPDQLYWSSSNSLVAMSADDDRSCGGSSGLRPMNRRYVGCLQMTETKQPHQLYWSSPNSLVAITAYDDLSCDGSCGLRPDEPPLRRPPP
jgi:hypothetical protein